MGEPKITIRKKSLNEIEVQRKRMEDTMRDAYHKAEQISSNSERRAELERLNSRMERINATAKRYYTNISETPEYLSGLSEWGQALRGGAGREDRKAIIDAIRTRGYSRSVYARRNNR